MIGNQISLNSNKRDLYLKMVILSSKQNRHFDTSVVFDSILNICSSQTHCNMAEIAVPLIFLGLSMSLKAIGHYYEIDTQKLLYIIGPQTREIIKQIVTALSLVSEMCRRNDSIKFQNYEMAFILRGFQIPLTSEDDFSKDLKEQDSENESEIVLNLTLNKFHSYIDSAINALSKYEKIFEINSTKKMFNSEMTKAYRKICGQKSIENKTNNVHIFSSIFNEMEMHREKYGSCEFVNIMSIFKKLTRKNSQKYEPVEVNMNSTTRCFSFVTSTDCKTALDFHKGLITNHNLSIDDSKPEGVLTSKYEYYSPQRLWELV